MAAGKYYDLIVKAGKDEAVVYDSKDKPRLIFTNDRLNTFSTLIVRLKNKLKN